MSLTGFTLPSRIASITGKLLVSNDRNSDLIVKDNDTGKCYRLADGDSVIIDGKTHTVKFDYIGKDKLGGQIGHLITLPEKDEWGYTRHIFFWRLPEARADFQPWLDAFLSGTDVTVNFAARPLVNRTRRYISGKMYILVEQGCGASMMIADTQKTGYAALHGLEEGDHLTIFDATGQHRIWQGHITAERLKDLYDRSKPASDETKFLLKAFIDELPCVVKLATPKQAP